MKPTILYVASAPRSGSTLLDIILGNLPGALGCGELRYFPHQAASDSARCACGQRVQECRLWKQCRNHLSQHGFGDLSLLARLADTIESPSFRPPHARDGAAQYIAYLESLYRYLFSSSDAVIIVDSTKNARRLALLRMLKGYTVYPIHLLRDPASVALSRQKRIQDDSAAFAPHPPMNVVASSVRWIGTTIGIRRVLRKYYQQYSIVRFEDILRNPATTLRALAQELRDANILGLEDMAWPPSTFAVSHQVAGNRTRLQGSLAIRPPGRRTLSPMQLAVVRAITAPLARLYGY